MARWRARFFRFKGKIIWNSPEQIAEFERLLPDIWDEKFGDPMDELTRWFFEEAIGLLERRRDAFEEALRVWQFDAYLEQREEIGNDSDENGNDECVDNDEASCPFCGEGLKDGIHCGVHGNVSNDLEL